jgi:hypothetical protein
MEPRKTRNTPKRALSPIRGIYRSVFSVVKIPVVEIVSPLATQLSGGAAHV